MCGFLFLRLFGNKFFYFLLCSGSVFFFFLIIIGSGSCDSSLKCPILKA